MKTTSKPISPATKRFPSGFTLTETIIAIGVLAVLLTGFIAVFTPAAQGIRNSINSQKADRLASALEAELVTLRTGQDSPNPATGFDKAFNWIKEGNAPATAILVYQYRGNPASTRADGTPDAMATITGEPGKDYIVQSMVRRVNDANLASDLLAVEGSVFFVKPKQLVFSAGQMIHGTAGTITNPTPLPTRVPPYPPTPTNANDYSEALLPFYAEFHSVPTKTLSYLQGPAFSTRFNDTTKKPVFTRNLAVRR
jgi:prepilin-type N-terminal cleavage/methylation domain-containing protein